MQENKNEIHLSTFKFDGILSRKGVGSLIMTRN